MVTKIVLDIGDEYTDSPWDDRDRHTREAFMMRAAMTVSDIVHIAISSYLQYCNYVHFAIAYKMVALSILPEVFLYTSNNLAPLSILYILQYLYDIVLSSILSIIPILWESFVLFIITILHILFLYCPHQCYSLNMEYSSCH